MASESVKQTKNGVTWEFIAKSGVANPDSSVGVYAGDVESYTVFWDEFAPIISKCHNIQVGEADSDEVYQPGHDFSKPEFEKSFSKVTSSRVRAARNLADFPYPNNMTNEQREEVVKRVTEALKALPFHSEGIVLRLEDAPFSEEIQAKLKENMVPLPHNNDKYLEAGGFFDNWPQGRAVAISDDWHSCVWMNEEDHLRLMARWDGYTLADCLERVGQINACLDKAIGLANHPRLGYLASCPSNLGTGMRVSVHLHTNQETADKLKEHNIQLRSSRGEASHDFSDGVYDVSLRQRLGLTERQIVEKVHQALLTEGVE